MPLNEREKEILRRLMKDVTAQRKMLQHWSEIADDEFLQAAMVQTVTGKAIEAAQERTTRWWRWVGFGLAFCGVSVAGFWTYVSPRRAAEEVNVKVSEHFRKYELEKLSPAVVRAIADQSQVIRDELSNAIAATLKIARDAERAASNAEQASQEALTSAEAAASEAKAASDVSRRLKEQAQIETARLGELSTRIGQLLQDVGTHEESQALGSLRTLLSVLTDTGNADHMDAIDLLNRTANQVQQLGSAQSIFARLTLSGSIPISGVDATASEPRLRWMPELTSALRLTLDDGEQGLRQTIQVDRDGMYLVSGAVRATVSSENVQHVLRVSVYAIEDNRQTLATFSGIESCGFSTIVRLRTDSPLWIDARVLGDIASGRIADGHGFGAVANDGHLVIARIGPL